MIVVGISGGLGNQMFQYAFGRHLQEAYHMPLVLETFRYSHTEKIRTMKLHRLHIPFFRGRVNGGECICRIASGAENAALFAASMLQKCWAEKVLRIPQTGPEGYARMIPMGVYATRDIVSYYPFEKTNAKFILVRGWFQSEKYFHDVAPMIKNELRVKDVSSDDIRNLAKKMMCENSVCVHIRRGDYVGYSKFDVCTEGYFRRAVDYVKEHVENPVFYVFSNSPKELDWIKENYSFLEGAHFVKEGKDEIDDLYLMYHCRHHIISNSTFSWWGSYLKLQEGITLCPERWLNDDMPQDIELDSWIKIPV